MSVAEIFESMDWGPAPESCAPARAWLDARGRRFGPVIGPVIGGRAREPGETYRTRDPATGEALAEIARCGAPEVEEAVAAARAAQGPWAALTGHARARHLYALARHLQKHARLFAVLETLDTGKPIRESRDLDVPLAIRHLTHHAGLAQLLPAARPDRAPLGVCAQVIPWNFPLLMAAWKVAPALAAGNAVVLKPAEQTPLSALLLAEVAQEAGLPPGVLNLLTGDGRTGEALVAHAGVDKVAFTGSTAVGRRIREITAGSGKRLTLELGGKSPYVVFEDADLDAAVEGLVDAIWLNGGQVCCAGSRLLVQEGIAADLHARLRARMERLRVGPPLDKAIDIGAIASPEHRARVLRLLDGAGGTRHVPAAPVPEGCFLPPMLIEGLHPSDPLMQEEIFGPVLVSTTFRTPEEAVALANDTRYGLAASVWTERVGLAVEMARRIEAGVVWINAANLLDAAAPFGGRRESGFGREGGWEGMEAYTRPVGEAGGAMRAAAATPEAGRPAREPVAGSDLSGARAEAPEAEAPGAGAAGARAPVRRGGAIPEAAPPTARAAAPSAPDDAARAPEGSGRDARAGTEAETEAGPAGPGAHPSSAPGRPAPEAAPPAARARAALPPTAGGAEASPDGAPAPAPAAEAARAQAVPSAPGAAGASLPPIDRTAKLYLGGRQARPDGGASRAVRDASGRLLGHVAVASRKDARDAVEAARASPWRRATGHARAQVLYYLAETLSGRAEAFAARLDALAGAGEAAPGGEPGGGHGAPAGAGAAGRGSTPGGAPRGLGAGAGAPGEAATGGPSGGRQDGGRQDGGRQDGGRASAGGATEAGQGAPGGAGPDAQARALAPGDGPSEGRARAPTAGGDEASRPDGPAPCARPGAADGRAEVEASIERLFHFAAWADKWEGGACGAPMRGAVLALREPVGVVAALCPDAPALLGLVTPMAAALALGNPVVLAPSEANPLVAWDLATAIEASDLPPGAVSLLTGPHADLAPVLAGHLGLDAVWCFSATDLGATVERLSALDLKRTWTGHRDWWATPGTDWLEEASEVKTVWLPSSLG